MKSILVGKSDGKRIYFVIDSTEENSDCVIKNAVGDTQVVNFWEYVDSNPSMHKIKGTEFHDYLWTGHQSKTSIHWYSVFVSKALPIQDDILGGAVVNKDVTHRARKSLDYENRAIDFDIARNTGQWSRKMVANWIDVPKRNSPKKKRTKKSKDE